MYSNQSLYYLQQLGIRPWLRRDESISIEPHLVIFVSDLLSPSAKILLENILNFLALDKVEFILMPVNEQSQYMFSNKSIIALIFGENLVNIFQEKEVSRVITLDPNLLIDNPIQKKLVLEHLIQVKKLLADIS